MTSPISPPKMSLAAELDAFLAPVECRAYAMLRLQSGDPAAAEKSLAAVIRVFAAHARELPAPVWPLRFWRLLLLTPQAVDVARAHWPPALEWLAGLAPGARQALLLRLVAGLLESDAAIVLDIEPRDYERLLTEVCPLDRQGRPDIEAWRRRAGAVYQQVRSLEQSPPQVERLRQLRTAVLGRWSAAGPPAPAPEPPSPQRPTPHRHASGGRRLGCWRWIVPTLLLVLVGGGGGLAWFLRSGIDTTDAAAAPLGPSPAAVAHNMLSLIADPAPIQREDLSPEPGIRVNDGPAPEPRPLPEFAAPLDQLPFLLWYAGGAPESAFERAIPDAEDGSEAKDAAVVEPFARVRPDARSLVEYQQAWAGLSEAQRQTVQQTATAFAALDVPTQAQMLLRFSQLDGVEQRGWLLGPKLGPRYLALQPLIGLVPESERSPLLTMLQGFDERQLGQLAILAYRVPPQERDALRQELMQVSADKRDGWLSRRVRQ